MLCPLCGTRKARRACPAVNETICAVCCGTKRLTEIACPASCAYLATSREHPAAVVKRQQERDAALLLPVMRGLTERQHQLFFLFHTTIVRHAPEGLGRLIDDDVAEAAAAMAGTLETAARGVIYEHRPASPAAQRLLDDLTALLARIRQEGATVYDREAAIVLRSVERGAREMRRRAEGGDAAYLTLMRRLLAPAGVTTATGEAGSAGPSPLILP